MKEKKHGWRRKKQLKNGLPRNLPLSINAFRGCLVVGDERGFVG